MARCYKIPEGVEGALMHAKAQGAEAVTADQFKKYGESLNIDYGEVIINEGDVITFPSTLDDLMAVCTRKVLTNVPPKRDGSQPVAYSFCVECNNGGARRIYLNGMCASYPEYSYDERTHMALPTGSTLQSDSNVAKEMRKLSSNLERMKYVLGKTFKCTKVITGTIANRVSGTIDGVRGKNIPVWEEV